MIKEKYEQQYKLKVADYICYDYLAPHGVLDIFQDVAGLHSNTYNMSYEEMLKDNKIWVLCRVKYKVIKPIGLYANINVTTYPKVKGLVDFDRETIISNNGEDCIIGISKWLVIDATTRKIIPAKRIEFKGPSPKDSLFNDKFEKIKDFDINGKNHYVTKVEFCDIDHNGHCNNACYAKMVLNAINLSKQEEITDFEINYEHESYLHDTLDMYYYKEGNTYFIKALCDEKSIFLCKIVVK